MPVIEVLNVRSLMLSIAAVVALAGAGQARTLTFLFSFTDTANGGGVVVGEIDGLQDNATGAAPTVEVTSADFGSGLYSDPGTRSLVNTFTVVNGTITSFSFASVGFANSGPLQTCCELLFTNATPSFPGQIAAAFGYVTSSPSLNPVSDFAFTALAGGPGPAPVPLPASLTLLAGAAAALAAVSRRHPGTAARSEPQA